MLDKRTNPFNTDQRALQEGMREYHETVISKEGRSKEVDIEDYCRIREVEPFRRAEIERDIEDFFKKNLDNVLPLLMISGSESYSRLLDRLGLTNEDIGRLGAGYFIRTVDGKKSVSWADEFMPEGRELDENSGAPDRSELIALAYLKQVLRVDTLPRGKMSTPLPARRYYYKPRGRYLAENDYGMRTWDETRRGFTEGDVTDASNMVNDVALKFRRITESLAKLPESNPDGYLRQMIVERRGDVQTRIARDVSAMAEEEVLRAYNHHGTGSYSSFHVSMREWLVEAMVAAELERTCRPLAEKKAYEETKKAVGNKDDLDLVVRSMPERVFNNIVRHRGWQLLRDFGLDSLDPVKAYDLVSSNPERFIGQLLRWPTEAERGGAKLNYVLFGRTRTPILVESSRYDSMAEELKSTLKDELARRLLEDKGLSGRRFSRGPQSPYYYRDFELYDLAVMAGDTAELVIEKDQRRIVEQVKGAPYLRSCMGKRKMEPDEMRKQLREAYKLMDSGIWKYLAQRERPKMEKQFSGIPEDSWMDDTWLGYLSPQRARQLFTEGKRMYWLASTCFKMTPGESQESRFYREHMYLDWGVYDFSTSEIPNEKLAELLQKNLVLVVAFLNLGKKQAEVGGAERPKEQNVKLVTLLRALETGKDIRGAILARDKQAFLEGLASGAEPPDQELLMADWPSGWRDALGEGEADLAYEYADDYLKSDPNCFLRFAEWRSSGEGSELAEILPKKVESKGQMDFRLCLSSQTPEVRGWFLEGARYVGFEVMQDYLLRFNALRAIGGLFNNLHDVLYWVPSIRNLEATDAKSILRSIQTMDDNQEFIQLVQRYRKNDDKLLDTNGRISSVRELKKRVLAIEADIDFSSMPREVVEITSAPGFSAVALKNLMNEARFRDLIEGKLDIEQPFRPASKVFAGRDLTEALREGLGSQKKGIRGTASDPKGLFNILNTLIKGRRIGDRKMQVIDLFDNIPPDLEEGVLKLLQEQKVDVGPIVEATVHAKSDPQGWVCGNYTDCCMPFGDYKNTDYMFNPGTQYFTVKVNGRIVAQSVIIDSRDTRDGSDVVVLDNIEIANNYKNYSPLLARIYQTFWTQYTMRPVKVGTGYSDLIPPGGKLEPNRYSFKYAVEYSDARGGNIYDMPKLKGVESLDRQMTMANLTERDVDLIVRLEKESYPEEGMVLGKEHIAGILQKQRELDVPGAASSFVVRIGKELAGYVLVLPEQSEYTGERVACIHDLAVLPKFRGSNVLKEMMERILQVATAYGVSIEAEARAKTTYAILMNRLVRNWMKRKGFEVTRSEKLEKYLGGEDFYFVRLENRNGNLGAGMPANAETDLMDEANEDVVEDNEV